MLLFIPPAQSLLHWSALHRLTVSLSPPQCRGGGPGWWHLPLVCTQVRGSPSPGAACWQLPPDSGHPSLAGSLGFPTPPCECCSLDFFLGSGHPSPSPLLLLAETLAVMGFLQPLLASVPRVRLRTFRPQVSHAASSCPEWVPSSL